MLFISPMPWSCQPLAWSMVRVSSMERMALTFSSASNWPQPSLKGTHMAMQGQL